MPRYCEPGNWGPASTPKAVARRLAAVLNALDSIDTNTCEGGIVDACREFKSAVIRNLIADGWRVRADDRWRVLPPRRGES